MLENVVWRRALGNLAGLVSATEKCLLPLTTSAVKLPGTCGRGDAKLLCIETYTRTRS